MTIAQFWDAALVVALCFALLLGVSTGLLFGYHMFKGSV